MLKHSFSDFSYAVNNESAKKGQKEILVCFMYNGTEVVKKLHIPEKEGASYIFEAKKIIDQEIRDGTLASYSHKFAANNKRNDAQPKRVVLAMSANKSTPIATAPKGGGKKWLIVAGCTVAVAGLILGTYFITKSLNKSIKECSVSFETSEGCNPQGPKVVEIGKKYECTFIPDIDKSVAIDYVKMGDVDTEYTFVDNLLTIDKVTDTNISIKAHTTPLTFKVTFNGVGCTSDGLTSIPVGGEYECDITPKRVTETPVISKIVMSNTELTDSDYTFDGNHLHITKPASGDIEITAGVLTTTFSVTCDYPSYVVFEGEGTVQKGDTYNCIIVSQDEKKKVVIDKVRMGTATLTPGPSADYYYNEEENQLIIRKVADGDISIMVSTTDTAYDVTYHLSNCELESGPAAIDAGAKLTCELKPHGDGRKNAIVGVTMGGVKLKENEYTFSDLTNILTVNTGATGNIVVSASSYMPSIDIFTATFEAGEGCTPIDPITEIHYQTSVSAKLQVTDSTNTKVHIDAIVMGGVALKEGEQYTFDPTAEGDNLTIFSVTNNVLIKFEAVPIGDIEAIPEYTLSDDGSHYIVKSFNLAGHEASEIDTITIASTYPENSNDALPVTEIESGVLNQFTNLSELSIPFIGGKKIDSGEGPLDGSQLFGYIFGDTPRAGASATWQNYYDAEEVLHYRKFIIPSSLRYVTVTGDSSIIPAGAFSGCRGIYEINFLQNNSTIIKNCAFQGCISLRNVTIPSMVTKIDESAFENCETLQHITLPDNLSTIAKYAFRNCQSISKLYLGENITNVGEEAFTQIRYGAIACAKTKTQVMSDTYWSKNWVDTGTTVIYGAISAEDYIDSENEFHYMLVKNDDNETGAFVAEYTSDSASALITIPDTITPKNSTNDESIPIFGLGDNMFAEYTATTTFVFNCSHLESIGSYCFAYCYALNELQGFANLAKLKEIGPYAFGACISLTSISVPTSVSSIGEYAFAYDKVTTFDLSNCTNLKSIEEGVFYYCYETTSITLPTGITYLGENVFEGCYKLNSLELNTTGIDTIPYALCYCANDLDHPERTPHLTSFTWTSNTPLKAIGGSAFGGCEVLTSVKLGDSEVNHLPVTVDTVGDYAFTRCKSISTFNIDKSNSGVTNINMGLEIFKGWTANQKLLIASGWVSGGSWFSTEATLAWGWKMSRAFLDIDGDFHCSKTGSDALVINKA